MKSKLFMELPCSINTQVENKRGENKKDMAHCMLIHLSIFGRPQEDYKQFFVGGRMCQSWKTRQPQVPKALGRSHSFLPPTQLLDNWGGVKPGMCDLWDYGQSALRAGKLPFLAEFAFNFEHFNYNLNTFPTSNCLLHAPASRVTCQCTGPAQR